MDIQTRIAVITVLAGGMFCGVANAGKQTSAGTSDYQQWISRFTPAEVPGSFEPGKTKSIKLIAVAVEGEKSASAKKHLIGSGISSYGAEVSTDGFTYHFSHSDFGGKGSFGGLPMPVVDWQRFSKLLTKLPGDHSHLPPADRRMLLCANVDGRRITRVYDRANAPDVVWEILRLGRCGIGSWVPQFLPSSKIDVSGFDFGGFLSVSADGKRILFTGANGPLRFWDVTTHEFLEEVRAPGVNLNSAAFSPNGAIAVVGGDKCIFFDTKTWKALHKFEERGTNGDCFTLTTPQFTADGRYVTFECSKPSMEIFDTQSWQCANARAEVPAEAIQFVHSPKNWRAIARLKSGEVVLWDTAKHRQICVLGTNVFLERVAFSPDESLVAIATAKSSGYLNYWGEPAIHIWKAGSGKLVHDLRPFERAMYDNVKGLAWSPDGEYVLAMTKPDDFYSSRSISVFNVRSGRHRGDFVGCPTEVNGMALLAGGDQLAAGCCDGKIRFWDLKTGLNAIRRLETSVEQ